MSRRYKLLLGVTLAGLEDDVNGMVARDPSCKLVQAFFAQGAGFIGAVEYEAEEKGADADETQPTKPAKSPGRATKSQSRK